MVLSVRTTERDTGRVPGFMRMPWLKADSRPRVVSSKARSTNSNQPAAIRRLRITIKHRGLLTKQSFFTLSGHLLPPTYLRGCQNTRYDGLGSPRLAAAISMADDGFKEI